MMTRRLTDEGTFLAELPRDGSNIGNISLRGQLGWQEEKYQAVRQRLLVAGAISLAKGKGGSVRRVQGDCMALLRLVPRDGGTVSKQRLLDRLGWDEDLFWTIREMLVHEEALVVRPGGGGGAFVRTGRSPVLTPEQEEQRLLVYLSPDGATPSLQQALEELRWTENRFWQVRARLVEKGLVLDLAGPAPVVPVEGARFVNKSGLDDDIAQDLNELKPDPPAVTQPQPAEPPLVFISYSRRDRELCDRLRVHLSPFLKGGLIRDVWHDGDIQPGREWDTEIRRILEQAQVILLLVSPDFLDSDYCHHVELKRAMQRHQMGEAVVVPIILRFCLWQSPSVWFSKLQALPRDAKPIVSWSDLDAAFHDVARELQRLLMQIRPSTSL
ncbi:MAG TPA: toll/interleukin-1 receptor domain-containing protein [Polyangia bacterium]|jgi:hypothetical protein|nr:toll/interleukin-1 receptor domain-containing protein [Polyangia bacterium]